MTDQETARALVMLAGAGAGQVALIAWQLRSTQDPAQRYLVTAKADEGWRMTCSCGRDGCYHRETVLNVLGAIHSVMRPWTPAVGPQAEAPAAVTAGRHATASEAAAAAEAATSSPVCKRCGDRPAAMDSRAGYCTECMRAGRAARQNGGK